MTPTIEEAAADYISESYEKYNLYHPKLLHVISDAYQATAERIMSLPLASLLFADCPQPRNAYATLSFLKLKHRHNQIPLYLPHDFIDLSLHSFKQ